MNNSAFSSSSVSEENNHPSNHSSASAAVDLTATHALETLAHIKTISSQYAKLEEQLTRELRQQRQQLESAHHQQTQQLNEALTAQREQLLQQRDEATDKITLKYNSRRNRIDKAHDDAVRFMPRRIRQVRENYIGNIQMRQHKLQQKLAIDLDQAKTNFEEQSSQITSLHQQLAKTVRHARRSFSGYGSLKKTLNNQLKSPNAIPASVQTAALQETLEQIQHRLLDYRQLAIPRFFSQFPLLALLTLALMLCAGLAYLLGLDNQNHLFIAGAVFIAMALVLIALQLSQAKIARQLALPIITLLGQAKDQHAATATFLNNKLSRDHEQLQTQYNQDLADLEAKRELVGEVEAQFKKRSKDKLEFQLPRIHDKIDLALNARIAAITHAAQTELERIDHDADSLKKQLADRQHSELEQLERVELEDWTHFQKQWNVAITPAYAEAERIRQAPAAVIADWQLEEVENWVAPSDFTDAVKFATLSLELKSSERPLHPSLALPGPSQITAPLALAFPHLGSLFIESNNAADESVAGLLNHIILRLFATMPPGKVAVTIIDPVGLGKNFAGLMHLADYEETLINRRIWTQRDQIDERLAELNEHIEKVIQMYLRSEYPTITDYNRTAGSVSEKYHFLVIADFPENFSDTAIRRLQSIAASGPRCGVYTLIHWDKRQTAPDGFLPDELRKNSIVLRQERSHFFLQRPNNQIGANLKLDPAPTSELSAALVHKIGKNSIDSNRVEVPFSHIAPALEHYWTNVTTHELRVPIGRTGATKLQYLSIGKGTRQHALFAGKTGSGKSTLFHVIITNLALHCSPDQVEFYLIDFKKGVEFKCYATKQLPHARVIAIESDREFGLSVLQRVDEELKRRGDLFRKLGVQDIAGYKKAGGTEAIPRTLLIIDEFQEFYTVDDQIAQNASVLFDRIVRQGRAFGIHVLLGSQTLGGAYTLARATLGQMVIRVALQCNEADAYLIMDENNAAPRLLTRPGEGIYNDAAGAIEGNSPFQVVWLNDEERDEYLDQILHLAEQRLDENLRPTPIVFEGNAPADVNENQHLNRLIKTPASIVPNSTHIWLGAPNSIKGPTQVTFHRQSGNHLLIVGQQEEAALTMLGVGLTTLAAQHPPGSAQFYFLHSATPDSRDAAFINPILQRIATTHALNVIQAHQVQTVFNQLAEELKNRDANPEANPSTIYLFIHDLHKFKKLRPEDDFNFSFNDEDSSGGNPANILTDLISQGPPLGIHLILTIDTYNNVNRHLNRKTLSEFEMRVLFQMSANDSASLIDHPKASDLGLHRAILYNEHLGTLETFRPYAPPPTSWFQTFSSTQS